MHWNISIFDRAQCVVYPRMLITIVYIRWFFPGRRTFFPPTFESSRGIEFDMLHVMNANTPSRRPPPFCSLCCQWMWDFLHFHSQMQPISNHFWLMQNHVSNLTMSQTNKQGKWLMVICEDRTNRLLQLACCLCVCICVCVALMILLRHSFEFWLNVRAV